MQSLEFSETATASLPSAATRSSTIIRGSLHSVVPGTQNTSTEVGGENFNNDGKQDSIQVVILIDLDCLKATSDILNSGIPVRIGFSWLTMNAARHLKAASI